MNNISEFYRFFSSDVVIPGSRQEYMLLKTLKDIIKGDSFKLEPIRTYYWKPIEWGLECEGHKIHSSIIPYSFDVDVEFSPKVFVINNIIDLNYYYNVADVNVFLFVNNELKEPLIVTTGDFLKREPSLPPTVPAVMVEKEDLKYIRGRCRLFTKIDFNPNASGYILDIVKNGNEDKLIHLSTSHDIIGNLDKVVRSHYLLNSVNSLYETHIISSCASIYGSPGFPSYPWSYGIETFLNLIKQRPDYSITLDNFHYFGAKCYSTHLIEGYLCDFYKKPSLEGYAYARNGIPNTTFSSSEIDELELKRIISAPKELNIEFKELLFNLIKISPSPLRGTLLNMLDKIKDERIQSVFLSLIGSIVSYSSANFLILPLHKMWALSYINNEFLIDVENYKRLYGNKSRRHILYINELKNNIVNDYITKINQLLEKFF
ncbi:hypothetical protein HS7_07650 [Sulfolobales archaeon HS-7]|nr:hypothetical protein HS7_07650 [Sulfolobales archaeon HS-7]